MLLVEIFIPVILVIIGFGFSKVQFYFNSHERVLSPSLYPLRQRLLVNSNLLSNSTDDIQPMDLIKSLPNYESAFDVTFKDYSYVNTTISQYAVL
jgi:hypothetical protein